jgi:DNA replication and repair protein RecF
MSGAPPRDWDAASYTRVSVPHEEWARSILERLELSGGERVLDAGCGSGRVTSMLIERLPEGSAFPKADLAIAGTLEEQIGQRPAVEIEEWLRGELAAGRMRDRAAGRTLDGPQRADFLVRHRPKDMPAALCSTGEQKALLVGIVLAHARLTGEMAGMTPILLLDEIAAHFDQHRRAALFAILEELGCQVFMTGTEPALFSALEGKAQFLTVAAGTVARWQGE